MPHVTKKGTEVISIPFLVFVSQNKSVLVFGFYGAARRPHLLGSWFLLIPRSVHGVVVGDFAVDFVGLLGVGFLDELRRHPSPDLVGTNFRAFEY